jgi:tRNA(fMet)-specific endonuclease VapC
MRRPAKLAHRFIQHTGQVAISSVTLAELYAGAYKHSQTTRLLALIADLLQEVQVIDFDSASAERFGQVRGSLTGHFRPHNRLDDCVGCAHLQPHVGHTQHGRLQEHSRLRLDDWLTP